MSDTYCDECGSPMLRRGDDWKCPVCDDVTLFSEDEESSQDGESQVTMYSEDDADETN